jgi:hypothetical protein
VRSRRGNENGDDSWLGWVDFSGQTPAMPHRMALRAAWRGEGKDGFRLVTRRFPSPPAADPLPARSMTNGRPGSWKKDREPPASQITQRGHPSFSRPPGGGERKACRSEVEGRKSKVVQSPNLPISQSPNLRHPPGVGADGEAVMHFLHSRIRESSDLSVPRRSSRVYAEAEKDGVGLPRLGSLRTPGPPPARPWTATPEGPRECR